MPVRHVFGLRGARCTGVGEARWPLIRRFQEALARAGVGGNSRQTVEERRKASGPVKRAAAVPGNGCSFPNRAWQRARCAIRRSASLFGEANGNASRAFGAKIFSIALTIRMQVHRGNDVTHPLPR